jgi:hypothetical protein
MQVDRLDDQVQPMRCGTPHGRHMVADTMTDIVMWAITALYLLYAIVAVLAAWVERPVVVWDNWQGRWRAARGRSHR